MIYAELQHQNDELTSEYERVASKFSVVTLVSTHPFGLCKRIYNINKTNNKIQIFVTCWRMACTSLGVWLNDGNRSILHQLLDNTIFFLLLINNS